MNDTIVKVVWVADKPYNPQLFMPVMNDDDGLNKPLRRTGLWTSTYTPDKEYISDWHRFCETDFTQFIDGNNTYLLKIRVDKDRIFTIHNIDCLSNTIRKYPSQNKIHSILGTRSIDYEALFKDYDVIHLTEQGQWHTRLSESNLYGWDADTWLWNKVNLIKQTLLNKKVIL